MSLPTRASPTKGIPTTTTARRTASRDITNTSSVKHVDGPNPQTATTLTSIRATPAPTRVTPRATSRTTSSTTRHDTATSSSRAGSASSSKSKVPTTTAAAIRTRTVSGPTTTSRPSRLKPPSTTQPAPRTLRSTPSTSTTTLAPTRTKAASTPSTTTQSNLHSELQQLTLLHHTAQPTLQTYLTSLTTHLNTHQQTLQAQQTTLQHLETAILTARSTDALDSWVHQQQRHGNSHPSRRVQTLATLTRDLEELTADDGHALEPLRVFEAWLDSVTAVREERNSGSTDPKFIAGLGWEWAEAMRDLRQRIELVVRGLRELSEPGCAAWAEEGERSGVGIAVVLGRHRALAAAVLAEVDVAVLVEAAVVGDEAVWERERLAVVVRELKEGEDRKGYMGAWAEA